MPNTPQEIRRRWSRLAATTCLTLVWLVALLWLLHQGGMACAYPDPPPGGCPADEVRAGLRFERWFGPALLAGPIAILVVWAWFGRPGHRYTPVWYLLAVVLFCAAPGLLVDAASSGFSAVDRPSAAVGDSADEVKLAVGVAAAIAASAGLAVITARRGHKLYAGAWAILSIVIATLAAVTILSTAI